jgi:hypothetical protein
MKNKNKIIFKRKKNLIIKVIIILFLGIAKVKILKKKKMIYLKSLKKNMEQNIILKSL